MRYFDRFSDVLRKAKQMLADTIASLRQRFGNPESRLGDIGNTATGTEAPADEQPSGFSADAEDLKRQTEEAESAYNHEKRRAQEAEERLRNKERMGATKPNAPKASDAPFTWDWKTAIWTTVLTGLGGLTLYATAKTFRPAWSAFNTIPVWVNQKLNGGVKGAAAWLMLAAAQATALWTGTNHITDKPLFNNPLAETYNDVAASLSAPDRNVKWSVWGGLGGFVADKWLTSARVSRIEYANQGFWSTFLYRSLEGGHELASVANDELAAIDQQARPPEATEHPPQQDVMPQQPSTQLTKPPVHMLPKTDSRIIVICSEQGIGDGYLQQAYNHVSTVWRVDPNSPPNKIVSEGMNVVISILQPQNGEGVIDVDPSPPDYVPTCLDKASRHQLTRRHDQWTID